MYDLVIGIPTLNEEDSVGYVVKMIDKGLCQYFPDFNALILNIDSNSADKTRKSFLSTKTKIHKLSILGGSGKGSNIFKLIKFALKNNIQTIGTIDGDISTIEPDWVIKLMGQVLKEKADYVSPIYSRNRYEGSTTNHFCVPILKKVFNANIYQPIGGEFAFNLKFAKYVNNQLKPEWSYKYGIDIFLTSLAIIGGFKIDQIQLGRKFHKPSFGKMIPMFEEVASTLVYIINTYKISYSLVQPVNKMILKSTIDSESKKPDAEKIAQRKNYAITNVQKILQQKRNKYARVEKQFLLKIVKNKYLVSKNCWEQCLEMIVKNALTIKEKGEIEQLVEFITPVFLLRVLTFYKEIENENSCTEVEKHLAYE